MGFLNQHSSISELHAIFPSFMLFVHEKTLDTRWQMLEAGLSGKKEKMAEKDKELILVSCNLKHVSKQQDQAC